jgi:spore germination protein KA
MNFLKKIYIRYLQQNIKNPGRSSNGKGTLSAKLVSNDLEVNLKKIKQTLGDSNDIVIRQFKIGLTQTEAMLLYIEGLADVTFIAENIMKSLMGVNPSVDYPSPHCSRMWEIVKGCLLTAGGVKEVQDLDAMFADVLSGDTALFIAGTGKAIIISTKDYPTRGIDEPATEAAVRGPREGFTESLRINTALIRRKIESPDLRFETMIIGRQSKTNVSIVYINSICNPKLVAEAKLRLARIDTEAILESGYIEAFIEDAPYSPFPTIGNTEKPDIVAAKILEGRIAILVDGTPVVLTMPNLFVEGFQSNEDYYSRPYYATLVRWLRYLAFIFTIYLPGFYVAVTTFHQEMIPTPLLITMAAAREGTPFPGLVEALLMGIIFEILREAGIRMPRPVGQAVSIVGALVIGEAAVSAGIVGAPIVIIIALTAITSFIVPSKSDVATLLRFSFTILSGLAGVYGIILGTLIVVIHLSALRSFGVPHLTPLSPLNLIGLKDVLIRARLWAMNLRPVFLGSKNLHRQGNLLKPLPPQGDENHR